MRNRKKTRPETIRQQKPTWTERIFLKNRKKKLAQKRSREQHHHQQQRPQQQQQRRRRRRRRRPTQAPKINPKAEWPMKIERNRTRVGRVVGYVRHFGLHVFANAIGQGPPTYGETTRRQRLFSSSFSFVFSFSIFFFHFPPTKRSGSAYRRPHFGRGIDSSIPIGRQTSADDDVIQNQRPTERHSQTKE